MGLDDINNGIFYINCTYSFEFFALYLLRYILIIVQKDFNTFFLLLNDIFIEERDT